VKNLSSHGVADNKPHLAAASLKAGQAVSQGRQLLMERRERPWEARCQGCRCLCALNSVSSSALQLPGSRTPWHDGRSTPTCPAPYSKCLGVFSSDGPWECFWREFICEILGMLPHRDNSQLLPEVFVVNIVQAALAGFFPHLPQAHRMLWVVSTAVFSGMGIC